MRIPLWLSLPIVVAVFGAAASNFLPETSRFRIALRAPAAVFVWSVQWALVALALVAAVWIVRTVLHV